MEFILILFYYLWFLCLRGRNIFYEIDRSFFLYVSFIIRTFVDPHFYNYNILIFKIVQVSVKSIALRLRTL